MYEHAGHLRTYKMGIRNGKRTSIVNTWSQGRCLLCQKFLGKRQYLYCSKHNTNKERIKRCLEKKLRD